MEDMPGHVSHHFPFSNLKNAQFASFPLCRYCPKGNDPQHCGVVALIVQIEGEENCGKFLNKNVFPGFTNYFVKVCIHIMLLRALHFLFS